MGAAAQLARPGPADLNDADLLAVRLVEERERAQLLGLGQGHPLHADGQVAAQGAVGGLFDLAADGRGEGAAPGKVQAQVAGPVVGAGLQGGGAEDLAQGRVKDVGARVGLPGAEAPLLVDGRVYCVAGGELAGGDPHLVDDQARQRALDVKDLGLDGGARQAARVAVLAAGLGVERRAVQDDGDDVSGGGHRNRAGGAEQGQHARLGREGLPGPPVRRAVLVQDGAEGRGVDGAAGLAGSGIRAGPLPLGVHQRGEALPVHLHALLRGHLQGQVDREAVRVVQQERLGAGQRTAALRLHLGDGGVQDGGALLEGGPEGVLLAVRLGGDPGEALRELGVAGGHAVAGHRQQLRQHRVVDAELAHRADRPAQDPAQDVAAALVAGCGAVAEEHQRGADVVGDHPQAYVRLRVAAVAGAGQQGGAVQDRAGLVDLVEVVDTLEEGGHPFQAHAGVDVAAGQLAEDGVAGLAGALTSLVLHEDEVPELHVAVLVDRRPALAAQRRAAVVVELGAGSAGAGDAHGPEVVLVAPGHDPLVRQSGDLPPDAAGVRVGVVDRDPDLVRVQAVAAVRRGLGGQVPGVGDGLLLEVVAEGEVAVHLEEGAVPGGLADLLDVQGADALLHARGPLPLRLGLAGEVGLEGDHAGVDEQQGRVRGGQRRARDDGVAARGEVVEEALSDVGGTHGRGSCSGRVGGQRGRGAAVRAGCRGPRKTAWPSPSGAGWVAWVQPRLR